MVRGCLYLDSIANQLLRYLPMKAIEFQSEMRPDHTLRVPDNLVSSIPCGQSLRVLVLLAEDTEDATWEQLAATDFGMGYADSDAIYDELSNR
jgi:hypothetical protein